MKIFVFGSNTQGIHGKGAARDAYEFYGAEWGVGEGRTGYSFAIPTKLSVRRVRRLVDIRASVDLFMEYAKAHPELDFLVTRVGCGYAGFNDDQMAPMFQGSPDNCSFDPRWERFGLKPWAEKPLGAE